MEIILVVTVERLDITSLSPPTVGTASVNQTYVKAMQTGQSRTNILCFKLCLSSMSFLCTIHLKRLIAVKKKKINAVICEKMT